MNASCRPSSVPGQSISFSLGPHGAFPVVSDGHDSLGRFQELAGAEGGSARDSNEEEGARWDSGHAEGAVGTGARNSPALISLRRLAGQVRFEADFRD